MEGIFRFMIEREKSLSNGVNFDKKGKKKSYLIFLVICRKGPTASARDCSQTGFYHFFDCH